MSKPAAAADVVMISGLRLINDVNCSCSSCACFSGVDVADVESDCNTTSCLADLRCRVLLLQLEDPTRGVGSGSSLTVVRLGDCMKRIPSGVE